MTELVWSGIVVADEPVERAIPRRGDVVPPPTPVPTLAVDDLSIAYRIRSREHQVVSHVSLSVAPGQTLAILGESGSGKSTIVKAIVGTLAPNARTLGGSIRVDGTELGSLTERQRRRLRGPRIGYVPQNPGGSLDPLIRVGDQVAEMFHTHGVGAGLAPGRDRDLPGPRRRPRRRTSAVSQPVLDALARAGFDEPEKIVRQYPHELSGGMQQRVLIAMALALEPGLLLADEPTSALDVTVQKTVLDLLDDMSARLDLATVIVTHDIGVARDRSDTVLVLEGGQVVEHGPTAQVLTEPGHVYTRQLLRDVPTMIARQPRPVAPADRVRAASTTSVVEVEGLVVDYRSATGRGTFRAVDDVSFRVDRGTTLAIVGESGSGKSTTVRTVARFVRPAGGVIRIADRDGRDLAGATDRELRRVVQLVYQNPHASLDPRQRIGSILREPMKALGVVARDARAARVAELLDLVGLPTTMAGRRPRELSGGQLQRVAIARALAVQPEILILDEPVSALDVTVQAQILELLASLQRELDLTYLFISHDLGVVRQVADRILVLKEGRTVEQGASEDVFTRTRSAYTRALLDAVPGRSTGLVDLTDPIPSTGASA